jgi:hypothetical protein
MEPTSSPPRAFFADQEDDFLQNKYKNGLSDPMRLPKKSNSSHKPRLSHVKTSASHEDDHMDSTFEETDRLGDEEEENDGEEEEDGHEYIRGLHSIPMQSPGDEKNAHELDMMTDGGTRKQRAKGSQMFFQTDQDALRYRHRDAAGRILRHITFRKRQKGEDETFWLGIFLSNLLSFGCLVALVVYLSQTDFFASHQNELFGTTVDNRFTVVAEQNDKAKIFLKSGS